jgi:hypothetical protein
MTLNPANLAFSSAFRYQYIAKNGSGNPLKGHLSFDVSTTYPNAVTTYTIPHNLGYVPFFKMWYSFGDGKYYALSAGPSTYNLDGNGFQMDDAYADATNLYFTADNTNFSGPDITGTVFYRIYAEPQT